MLKQLMYNVFGINYVVAITVSTLDIHRVYTANGKPYILVYGCPAMLGQGGDFTTAANYMRCWRPFLCDPDLLDYYDNTQ